MPDLADRARAIAEDRDRGASELLQSLLPLLQDAIIAGETATIDVARVVCRGQPAMAPLWNACAAALADHHTRGRFARIRAEMERAPAALTRLGVAALGDLVKDSSLPHVLTLSYSGSVRSILERLVAAKPFRVTCGEGRPRFEGRTMATALAAVGARVTLATDAALTTFLPSATAVVVGADALGATFWINKAGTRGLAAAASLCGVPVYVVATRDKAMGRLLEQRQAGVDMAAVEVWADPPSEVAVANPYFERIASELATLFLTEAGPLTPADLPAVAERYGDDIRKLIDVVGSD